jgi:hypothetical protein
MVKNLYSYYRIGFVVARFGLFLREFGIRMTIGKSGTLTHVPTHYASSFLGVALVLVGLGLGIYALKNYLHANQAIKNGTYTPKNSHLFCRCRPIDFRSCNSCLFDLSPSLRMPGEEHIRAGADVTIHPNDFTKPVWLEPRSNPESPGPGKWT